MGKIVIAGGGVCGMSAAMMLADDGHSVTVIERDGTDPPSAPEEAFQWNRKSVAQFGLGHWMHSRGTAILRERVPRAFELLEANGGFEFNVVKYLLSLQPDAEATAEDDRFDLVTGRRSTIEWALATAAADHHGVTMRRGDVITGLVAKSDGAVPHVEGVRLESGEVLTADVVVDATGRRSPTPNWLADIGAVAPIETGEESGFAYYGRYLSSPDGERPAIMAPLLSPIGSYSILTLPADNNTWSVTLYGLADDKALRRFRDPEIFDRVVRASPLHAHWLEGTPLSEMNTMAGGVDRHRDFVVDGAPCATGILTVGDASACTNPSLGRGMSLGLMHVEILCDSIAKHLDDPAALALAFHEQTAAEFMPYHHATTQTDRRRVRDMAVYRDGGTPEPTPAERLADVINGCAASDPVATRVFGAIMGCNELAETALAADGVFEHLLALGESYVRQEVPGPDRQQLLELVS